MMQGNRVYVKNDDDLWLQLGEYGINPKNGDWYARTPNGLFGCLKNHQVIEHEDGTITASPSILVTGYDNDAGKEISWHGYLERGVWREV